MVFTIHGNFYTMWYPYCLLIGRTYFYPLGITIYCEREIEKKKKQQQQQHGCFNNLTIKEKGQRKPLTLLWQCLIALLLQIIQRVGQ